MSNPQKYSDFLCLLSVLLTHLLCTTQPHLRTNNYRYLCDWFSVLFVKTKTLSHLLKINCSTALIYIIIIHEAFYAICNPIVCIVINYPTLSAFLYELLHGKNWYRDSGIQSSSVTWLFANLADRSSVKTVVCWT